MSPRTTQRSPWRWSRLLALFAVLALALAACGGGSDDSSSSDSGGGSSSGGGSTLNTAFVGDMQVPDPDIFYESEGNQVIMSTYEGLVRYQQDPPANTIEPLLADSWVIAPDGLTYTFTLHPDVKFIDGTDFNSEAMAKSFERRTEVAQGPSYMLEQVESTETPDPLTFVVHLKKPVSAFMDYLASPYGPKAVSPTGVEENAKGDDLAQNYLETHSLGTGAYSIKEFTLGQRYVLGANPDYWAGEPKIKTININIVPDFSTQQVQLEGGDLDILHTSVFPADTINSFKSKSGFQVIQVPSLQMQLLNVNPNKAPFDNLDVRKALAEALDREKLTSDVWGAYGKVAENLSPAGELPAYPPGVGAWDVPYDPAALQAIGGQLPSGDKKVTIAYTTGQVNDQRTAEAIQTVLNDAGFDATVKPETNAVIFGLRDAPENTTPNLLIWTLNPDAAQQDTHMRIFYTTGGFLNFLKGGSAAADTEMDNGLFTNDPAVVAASYGKAAELLNETYTFVPMTYVDATFLATDKLSGQTSTGAAPLSLNFSTATLSG